MSIFRDSISALIELALPPRCHLCRTMLDSATPLHICNDCLLTFETVAPPFCSICGTPFEGVGNNHPCGLCIQHPPPWKQARAAFIHDGGCRKLINSFKYEHRSHLRRPIAMLTASVLKEFVESTNADCLIPVPLHCKRLRNRGFNQSLLVAELTGSIWKIPVISRGLIRVRNTRPQMEMTAAERAENIKGAFAPNNTDDIKGKSILLVDDVFTTGATVAECSRVLKHAGAKSVSVATVARARAPGGHSS